MSFNPSQREAIRHKDGPMLVLAGPGSGKTLVITERTRHLITEYGINPANILVITFTRAAATEMKERFLRLMGGKSSAVTFGTFHAVFFMILKHAYHYQAENIIREEQRVSCMREIIKRHRLEYEDESEFIAALLGEIGLVKNSGISLDHYYSTNCGEEVFRRVYSEYHEYLYAHHLIDFEDMLLYTWELFKERKDILAAWQKKYPYILIDEFQDINQIQRLHFCLIPGCGIYQNSLRYRRHGQGICPVTVLYKSWIIRSFILCKQRAFRALAKRNTVCDNSA